MTLGRGFSNAYFLYKRKVLAPHPEPHCRQRPVCRPASLTVAPHGEIRTLDEHGLLADRFGELARHGAHFGISTGLMNLRLTARTGRRSRGSPKSRTAFELPRFPSDFDHHPPPKLFCQQR